MIIASLVTLAYVSSRDASPMDMDASAVDATLRKQGGTLRKQQSGVSIGSTYIEINSKKYYRYNAGTNGLGRIGERKLGLNGVTTYDDPPKSWMVTNANAQFNTMSAIGALATNPDYSNIVTGQQVTLQQEESSSLGVDLGQASKMSLSAGESSSSSAGYVLQQIMLENTLPIQLWFNGQNGAEDSSYEQQFRQNIANAYWHDLANYNAYISSVWLLVECLDPDACESASNCGNAKISGGTNGDMTISGSGCKNTTVSYSKNSIMAYSADFFCLEHTGRGPSHQKDPPNCQAIYDATPGLTPLLCGCKTS
jgi:hypothetical protein